MVTPIYMLKKSMYIYIVPATAPAILRSIQTNFSGSLPSQDKWVGQEISVFTTSLQDTAA